MVTILLIYFGAMIAVFGGLISLFGETLFDPKAKPWQKVLEILFILAGIGFAIWLFFFSAR